MVVKTKMADISLVSRVRARRNNTSTSTLFNKNIDYNRLARKIAIANLGEPVKRKIK